MSTAPKLSGLSLKELKATAARLGIVNPKGHKGHKATWISAIEAVKKAKAVNDSQLAEESDIAEKTDKTFTEPYWIQLSHSLLSALWYNGSSADAIDL